MLILYLHGVCSAATACPLGIPNEMEAYWNCHAEIKEAQYPQQAKWTKRGIVIRKLCSGDRADHKEKREH